MEYTRKLAAFCAGLGYEMIPAPVVKMAKLAIMDSLGNIVGATTLEFGKTIGEYVRALGDREEATVLGLGFKSSTRNAAFVNGSLAETIEMQDGYTKGGCHPCCGTISAALAVGEWGRKTGKDLITAVLAGYEAGNRVAASIHISHLVRGFQPTGTAGTVGAAAAAARIQEFDEEHLFQALNIAGFILPISSGDSMWGGYNIKPVHGGAAAKVGIESALLAQQGLKGAPLEGDPRVKKGFCRITSNEEPKFEKMVEGLGEQYTIEEVYFKPYASCRMNHGPAEITLDLRQKYGLNPDHIQKILVRTYEFAHQLTGSVRTDVNSPFTLCQFSMSYAIAAALMDGEVGLRQLTAERIRDPKIHALASKVEILVDPEMQKLYPTYRRTVIEFTTKNGEKVSGQRDFAKGDYRNPMTEAELIEKFLGLAGQVLGREKARKVMEMVLDLENLASLEKLINHLK